MDDLIGKTIGGYQIVERIGKGGMAVVYKAYQPSLDRDVAIKILPSYYAEQDETFLVRFKREARAIAKLRHPNILMVMDSGEQDGIAYIVMEYVDAGTLKDRLTAPLSLSEIYTIVGQVASALDYAHEQGIVHRDIKPSNILMPKPEWILLTDFGLAKIVGGSMLTQSGLAVGTPAYMSPEQGSGKRVDKRTDIYSLGIMLYEMVVGEVPYKAETPMAVIVKHIVDPLPMPRAKNPDVPEALQRIILKSMAKNPDDRYQRAGEIAGAIKEVVDELPGWSAAEMKTVSETREPLDLQAAGLQTTESAPAPVMPKEAARKKVSADKRKKRKPWAVALAAVGVVAVFAVAGLLFGGTLWEQVQPYFARETLPGDDLVSPPLDEGSPLPIEGGDQFAKASRLLDEGQPGQARDVFKRALEENPGRWEDFMQIVYDVYGMGNTPLTIDLLEAGFSVAGKYDLPSREWLGWLYLDENRVEDAKNLFREMVKEHPTWGGAYEGMIASYSHTNDEQAAIDFLKTMADQFPDEPNVPYALGALYLNLEDYPQAKNYFGKVIQMAPGDPRGYMQMAGVYVGLGDNRNAEDAIQQALRLAPDDGAFLDSAAWWYYDMGKYDIAIENFQKAIENGYDEAWTYLGLAQSLFEFGGAENQIRDALKKAEEKAEKDALLLAQIGWAYVDLGDCPRAVDLFHTALDIAPSLFEAQDGLDKCRE